MTAVNPSPESPPPSPIRPPVTPQEARAQAKAAKAHAKALRPWYRKKRWWLLALVAVVVVLVAASGGGDDSTNTVDVVDKGIGSQDASADVKVIGLKAPDVLGFREPELLITNNSSKRSNYLIELSLESRDGKTQYDSTNATARNVEPGQSTSGSVVPFTKAKDAPPASSAEAPVVKVKSVSRTAA